MRRKNRLRFLVIAACFTLFALIGYALMLLQPPRAFPLGERIEIPAGATLVDAAHILKDAGTVRSALALQLVLIGQFSETGVRAGVYQFNEPLSAPDIARAISSGTHGIPLSRITIPEGLRNEAIDQIADETLMAVEAGDFLERTEGREGYLFPDTYYVPELFTAEELVALMAETFDAKIEPLAADIAASQRTLEEIITMASILEREADTEESMRLVSGILWTRYDIGMALQVDASFSYLLGKTSEEVTLDDLAIDSPYNTYRYVGLPPTPLNNPGMQAIRAALLPTESPYLYYLTAPDGTFYYAETYAEHEANIEQYLRQ